MKSQNIIDNAKEIKIKIDKNYFITYSNNYTQIVLGFSREELLYKNLFQFLEGGLNTNIIESINSALKGEKRFCEIALRSKSGQNISILCNLNPIIENNDIVGFMISGQNITEQKKYHESLVKQIKYSQSLNKISKLVINFEQYENIFESISQILGETLLVDRCLIYEINLQNQKLYGLSEWLNPDYSDIMPTKGIYPIEVFKSGVNYLLKYKTFITTQYDNINPIFLEDNSYKILHEQMSIKTGFWFPFNFSNEKFYLIVLNQVKRNREFNEAEINFIENVAKQITIVLSKSNMLNKIRINAQIENALNTILQISLKYISLDQMLEEIFHIIINAPFVSLLKKGSIFLTKENEEKLELKYSYNLSEYLLTSCAIVPFGACLCGRAAKSQKIIHKECMDSEHEITYNGIMDHGHYNVPIVFNGRCLGVIVLYLEAHSKSNEFELRFLQAVSDILANVLMKRKFEDYFKKLSAAVEQSQFCTVITDTNGKIEYLNERSLSTYNLSKEQLLGKNIIDILCSDYLKLEVEKCKFIKEAILKKEKWEGEIMRSLNNENMFIYLTIFPVFDEINNTSNIVLISYDITEKKRMMDDLIVAKQRAEQANKMKDAFISNMSHEIRTPLNGILGLISILKENYSLVIKSEDEYLFKGIEKSSNRIIKTIDMILNYSKLHSGVFYLKPVKVELISSLKSVIDEYYVQARKKNISLEFNNSLNNVFILADPNSLTHIFSNLIDNAIKYTDKGFVKVNVFKNDDNEIILEIMDSRIGISEEFQQRIYEPYSQENIGYGKSYQGIGLGLSIVKKIIDLNNFKIFLSSKKNVGTTFTINFNKPVK